MSAFDPKRTFDVTNMPTPKFTATDGAWVMLFMALFLPCIVAGMFVAAAYIEPAVLGTPNSVERHGVEKVIDFALLFGGFLIGGTIAMAVFCFFTRRYVSADAHQRWSLQLENGRSKLPGYQIAFARFLLKLMRPNSSGHTV
jgi:uncharacterized membrane protein YjgN (DUF898 family)